MFRVIYFIGIIASVLFFPVWIFGILAFWYAIFYRPYELFFLAVLTDAFFSDTTHDMWYTYTILIALIFLITRYLTPYLSFTKKHT